MTASADAPAYPYPTECPKCTAKGTSPIPLERDVFKCSLCGWRVAYGQSISRWVVEPDADPRFMRIKIQRLDGSVIEELVDGGTGFGIAQNIISLLRPHG